MSDRVTGGEDFELLMEEAGSDDEITLFPDSASVVGASERTVPLLRRVGPTEGSLTFYANGSRGRVPQSDLGATWRRTEAVFYFSVAVVVFVFLAFAVYFAYVYISVLRRGPGATKSDRSGARWTRLTERPE